MFFRFKAFTGPQAYKFKDPDTGREFNELSKDELIRRITAYRQQNNLETIDELSMVLESYWCGLPENAGRCGPAGPLRRGFLGYLKGGVALVKNLLYHRVVEQKEADRRSEICAGCILNVFPDKGAFLSWSDDIMIASTGRDRRSKRHDDIGQCAGCTCPLRAKVWYGGRIDLTKQQESDMKQANPACWQLPENQNG